MNMARLCSCRLSREREGFNPRSVKIYYKRAMMQSPEGVAGVFLINNFGQTLWEIINLHQEVFYINMYYNMHF